jgi:competence protein ComEC
LSKTIFTFIFSLLSFIFFLPTFTQSQKLQTVLFKEIPFLRIIIPLCLGIISGMLFAPGTFVIIILIILIIAGYAFSLFYNARHKNHVYGVAVFVAFFGCGIVLNIEEKNSISRLESVQTTFLSTVSDFPSEKENTYMVTIELNKVISGIVKKSITGSVLLYHRKDSIINRMLPGDRLLIRCTPLEIENRGNPYEFDYKSFMASKRIRYYAFTGKNNIIGFTSPKHRKLKYSALIWRERIIKMYEERGVKGKRLALVSAITLGQKNRLDPDVKQIFINAGIMHIMAVSGLHAGVLSLFIYGMLFFMKGKFNPLRIIITILILWAFAFVTGLTPSVLRATLMFSFLQAGNLLNRRVNGINSVLASAFILIIIQPSVITDAGFLLSYAAVIYIIGFYKELYIKLHFKRWLPDKIWQSVVVTLVAQAGTLPLTIMLFNRFPVYFILTNVIIVPLSSLLIIIGCLVPMTFAIVPVSEFLANILSKLTGLTEFLTSTAAALPYSTIDRIGMTTVECILLTFAVSLLVTFLIKKQLFSIKYPVVAFIIFAIAVNFKKIENSKTNELIVYNNPSFPTTGIRTGNTLNLLTVNDSVPGEVLRHAATKGLKIKLINYQGKPMLVKVGTKNILITDSLRFRWLRDANFNIIVLTGKRPYIEKNILPQSLPENIVFSSETAPGFRLRFSLDQLTNKTVRFVRKSGAFVGNL